MTRDEIQRSWRRNQRSPDLLKKAEHIAAKYNIHKRHRCRAQKAPATGKKPPYTLARSGRFSPRLCPTRDTDATQSVVAKRKRNGNNIHADLMGCKCVRSERATTIVYIRKPKRRNSCSAVVAGTNVGDGAECLAVKAPPAFIVK